MPFCNSCGHSASPADLVDGKCKQCRGVGTNTPLPPDLQQREASSSTSISCILKKYQHKDIMINLKQSGSFTNAALTAVGRDCFTVIDRSTRIKYTYPFVGILSIAEGLGGESLVIQIYHQIIYKGATGISIGIGTLLPH